eukprot:6166172-Amphidinium_carterae.1
MPCKSKMQTSGAGRAMNAAGRGKSLHHTDHSKNSAPSPMKNSVPCKDETPLVGCASANVVSSMPGLTNSDCQAALLQLAPSSIDGNHRTAVINPPMLPHARRTVGQHDVTVMQVRTSGVLTPTTIVEWFAHETAICGGFARLDSARSTL